MKVWTQVVGVDTGDASPAVLVVTEGSRYLVNVGEGLQRFCAEHKARLVKLEGIFLTEISQDCVGGLPGMVLTVADMGKKQIRLFGGPGLIDYMFATRHFLRRSDVILEAREFRVPPSLPSSSSTPAVIFSDLIVQPVVVPSPHSHTAHAHHLGRVDEALHSLHEAHTKFIPLKGASISEILHGSDPSITDGETPSARLWTSKGTEAGGEGVGGGGEGWGMGKDYKGPGNSASEARLAVDIEQRENMRGLPLPVPFNPFLVAIHGNSIGSSGSNAEEIASASSSPGWGESTEGAIPAVLLPNRDSSTAVQGAAVSYIFTTAPVTGKFHPDRAIALGVPKGRDFGRLVKGETVEVTDVEGGITWVKPEQVKDPAAPGQSFGVAACPSAAWVHGVSSHTAWAAYKEAAAGTYTTPSTALSVLYHTAGPNVTGLVAYASWMASFGPRTRHIMLHPAGAGAARSALAAAGHRVVMRAQEPGLVTDITARDGRYGSNCEGQSHAADEAQPVLFVSQAQQLCRMHLLEPTLFSVPAALTAGDGAVTAGATETGRLTPLQARVLSLLSSKDRMDEVMLTVAARQEKQGDAGLVPGSRKVSGSSAVAATSVIAVCGAERGQVKGDPVHVDSGLALSAHHILPLAQAGADLCAALRRWTPLDAVLETLPDESVRPYLDSALRGGGTSPSASSLPTCPPLPHPDAMLLFTGTASAVPSKYRNVSGMYLLMPPPSAGTPVASTDKSEAAGVADTSVEGSPPLHMQLEKEQRWGVILDCGEGTYGQLARLLGRATDSSPPSTVSYLPSVDIALARLRLLWVSHMHADHHLGALRLIAERASIRAARGMPPIPLLIVGPSKLALWLLEAARVDASIRGPGTWVFVDAEWFCHHVPRTFHPSLDVEADLCPPAMCPLSEELNDASGMEPLPKRHKPDEAHAHAIPAPLELEPEGEVGEDEAMYDEEGEEERQGEGADDDGGSAGVSSRQEWNPPAPAISPYAYPVETAPLPFPVRLGPVTELSPECVPWGTEPAPGVVVDGPSTGYCAPPSFVHATMRALGLSALRTIHVRHCYRAYGLRLEAVSVPATGSGPGMPWPWSVVYSGDTRPCRDMVALVHGGVALKATRADGAAPDGTDAVSWTSDCAVSAAVHAAAASSCGLLVHEATFDDTEEGRANASAKKHSTVADALAVAAAGRAGYTILTHFSARYPKLPVLKALKPETLPGVVEGSSSSGGGEEQAVLASGASSMPALPASNVGSAGPLALSGPVAVAYDLCSVRGRDLPRLHAMLPALHLLYAEPTGTGALGEVGSVSGGSEKSFGRAGGKTKVQGGKKKM